MMSHTEDNAIRSLQEKELDSVSGGLDLIHETPHSASRTECVIVDEGDGGGYAGIMFCFRQYF
jgi:hypothetical protein